MTVSTDHAQSSHQEGQTDLEEGGAPALSWASIRGAGEDEDEDALEIAFYDWNINAKYLIFHSYS